MYILYSKLQVLFYWCDLCVGQNLLRTKPKPYAIFKYFSTMVT